MNIVGESQTTRRQFSENFLFSQTASFRTTRKTLVDKKTTPKETWSVEKDCFLLSNFLKKNGKKWAEKSRRERVLDVIA